MSKKEHLLFTCNICDYDTSKKTNYDKHILTLKHKNRTKKSEKEQKSSTCFYCNDCRLEYDKKSNYDRHLLTLKHKKGIKVSKSSTDIIQSEINQVYECEYCTKVFKARNSLWYHKKTCNMKSDDTLLLMKDKIDSINNQIHDLKDGTTITHLNINGGTINQNLNINVFLNETCKDAMNLSNFVDGLKITLGDLMKTKELGYVNGISNVIIKNLGDLKIEDRPIHCSNVEKSNFYIKNNDEWEPDNGESVSKAIEASQQKHYIALSAWMKENPNWESDELKTEECIKMMKHFSNGSSEQNSKIISNIGTAVILDKNS